MTTRSGRVVKKSFKVLDNEDEPPKPAPKPKSKPQPKPKPQSQSSNLPIPAIVLPLNIDVEDAPIQKLSKQDLQDYSNPENPFYKNFYIPKDNITIRFDDVVNKIQNKDNGRLPPMFDNGIVNLEIKPNLYQNPKNIVSFNNLKDGKYHTASSKSDVKNIVPSIIFFTNNLPSFIAYKDVDDLSYILHSRRSLITELLEYFYQQPKWSVATLKSRINAIIRIYRLAYGGKSYLVYKLLSLIIMFLGQEQDLLEGENKLSALEETKFLEFNKILGVRQNLENSFNGLQNKLNIRAYDRNQDLILLSLYVLRPPLRNEIKELKFTSKNETEGDWIYIKDDKVELILNEEKKKHDAITFDIVKENKHLAELLKESYRLYPRLNVFTKKDKYPDVSQKVSVASLDGRIKTLFNGFGKNVGINSIRSSFVSHFFNIRKRTYNEMEALSVKMRTSVEQLLKSYNKFIPSCYLDIKKEPEPEQEIIPIQQLKRKPENELTSYDKHRISYKKYYEQNKQKIMKQHKEYLKNNSYKIRVIRYLNDDPNYIKRIKPETITKYNIKLVDGKYV